MSYSIVCGVCVHEREREGGRVTHLSLLPYPYTAPTTYSNYLGNRSGLEHAIHHYIDYYLLSIVDPVIMLCITNEATYSIQKDSPLNITIYNHGFMQHIYAVSWLPLHTSTSQYTEVNHRYAYT